MGAFIDLTGQTFGRLTVIRRAGTDSNRKKVLWECKCSCGNETIIPAGDLRSGRTKSCGCLRSDTTTERSVKHGLYLTDKHLYILRGQILDRCYNPNATSYKNYGGRGIYVCKEWQESPQSFVDWAKENGYCKGLQIDRIDNEGPYSPENCRFVDRKTNMRNTRRTRTLGSWKSQAEVLDKLGLYNKYEMIRYFVKRYGSLSDNLEHLKMMEGSVI